MVSIVLSIFAILILLVIFFEYRNEKKYQEKRRKKNTKKKSTLPTEKAKERIVKPQVSISFPKANHPEFSHIRLVEMGLSDEEAKDFVGELIPQIEAQIPLIKEAILRTDFQQMERLTHNIKGSATNIGTGGISDLLVEYNTYLKNGTDITIAKTYFEHLIHYTNELKEQYA